MTLSAEGLTLNGVKAALEGISTYSSYQVAFTELKFITIHKMGMYMVGHKVSLS